MAKMKAGTKAWITKLYKSGAGIDEIHAKIKTKTPKITKVTINAVIRKHLITLADSLWSSAIKVKFGWKCAYSNKTDNLEAHHLIRRGNLSHRWTVENGICLNAYYHALGSDIAAHGATDVVDRDWMKKTHKEQWAWFELHRDDPSVKPDLDEMLAIVRKLEGAIKNGYNIDSEYIGKRREALED